MTPSSLPCARLFYKQSLRLKNHDTAMPLKILFISTGLGRGGAEMMLYRLIKEIDNDKFQISVITLCRPEPVGALLSDIGIPVLNIDLASFRGLKGLLAFRRSVKKFKPDIIQGWMSHGNLVSHLASLFFCKRVPVISGIRRSLESLSDDKWTTLAAIRIDAWFSRFSSRVIYASLRAARLHEEYGYLHAKSLVIPNGFDTTEFAPNPHARLVLRKLLGVPDDAIVVGLIARYHPVKNHGLFIQAARYVLERCDNVFFLFAGHGTGPDNFDLVARRSESGLNSRLFLLGERRDVQAIQSALDIASLTSNSEAFPNVICEAMSCEVPCVVTDVGDAAWIVGDTGTVVRPRDPESFGQALVDLIMNGKEHRERLGKIARQRIIELFSIEAVAKCYEDIYATVHLHGIRAKN